MSRLEKLKEKARSLEARDPKGAIDTWLEALKAEEGEREANPDLSVYNRIGDLCLKIKDHAQAADYYERAVDKYAELGFHNNAIAMCNKVLRNAPGRPTAYLKLAKLYASKGFLAEAKQNFVEYAERMHKIGKIQHAFAALKEVTDLSPTAGGLREMLEEQLQMYGAPHRPGPEPVSGPVVPKVPAEPSSGVGKPGSRKTSSLVFLDLDEPRAKAKPLVAPRPASPPEPERPPLAASLLTDVTPEPDSSLKIEATSLADGAISAVKGGAVEGLERTVAFGEIPTTLPAAPSLRDEDEASSDTVEPLPDLEPTAAGVDAEEVDEVDVVAELEPLVEGELEIEPPPPPPPKPSRMAALPHATPPPVAPVVPRRPQAPAPRVSAPHPASSEGPKVRPFMPKRPTARPGAAPPKRQPVVEVPPLELEPDFESAATAASHDVDDEPLAVDPGAKGYVQTEFVQPEGDAPARPGRRSGFIDLGLDEVNEGEQTGSLVFANVEAAPLPPSIEQLEALVADDPDDPEAHQALGEALIEAGDRERGIEELDLATAGFENRGELGRAQDLTGEILRLDPNSVRHRQKLVECAFKSGDKARLIDAYLELADTLLRGDLPDKARAVYQRVAEHDPRNERAQAALGMLAPVTAPIAESKPRAREPRVAPKDAKMTVRDEPVDAGDFVDLAAMILEDESVTRNTRMTVADEEPTGDEEKDFRDMLARFKQGIDENIEETDFQSHYDLGVAFKEMGLLDEAIAEFQKALAAPEGKLRTTEALGACFIEKRAYVVAESILRRGLELPASGDQERLAVLYWLARALEELGRKVEARGFYGRVFAVDIRFADVAARVKALAKAK
jgi:tetratricopeptide (TPR) repeat protein